MFQSQKDRDSAIRNSYWKYSLSDLNTILFIDEAHRKKPASHKWSTIFQWIVRPIDHGVKWLLSPYARSQEVYCLRKTVPQRTGHLRQSTYGLFTTHELNWSDLQQVFQVTRRDVGVASGLAAEKLQTVGAQAVRALWTLWLECTCLELEYSLLHSCAVNESLPFFDKCWPILKIISR